MHLKESLLWPGPRPHLPRAPDGFRTGSNGFRQNAFERNSIGAQAPATFTTGSERAPADSRKKHVLVKTARRQMSSQEKPGADIGSRPTHRQRRNTYYSNSTAPNEFSGRNLCRIRKQIVPRMQATRSGPSISIQPSHCPPPKRTYSRQCRCFLSSTGRSQRQPLTDP